MRFSLLFRSSTAPLFVGAGVLLAVLAFFLPLPVHAYNFDGCGSSCHADGLSAEFARLYLHSPFKQQQCGECHAANPPAALQVQSPDRDLLAASGGRQKITWLADSGVPAVSHAFFFPGEKTGKTLVVDLQDKDGGFSRQKIAVPLLADLPVVEDTGREPVISGVQVLNVQRGVFLSVTVGWRTDTLADATVRYGNQDLSQTSDTSKRFSRQHEVVLYGLQPDQSYSFSVVSRDLFGRVQTSKPMAFSTSQPLAAPRPLSPDNPSDGAANGLTTRFQRLGSAYLLEMDLEQPASVHIGSMDSVPPRSLADNGLQAVANEEAHAGLSSGMVISMEACRVCHTGQATATHPVNVYPKPGMVIPSEYPTLPDGRITCSSCHEPHGSDFEYLARKSSKRELCVGCHRDML